MIAGNKSMNSNFVMSIVQESDQKITSYTKQDKNYE
jgi:hypothetical protein